VRPSSTLRRAAGPGDIARIVRTSTALRAAILVVACAALLPATAAAASSDDLAQQLFREGVEAARQERWIDARQAFEKAYSLSARPVLLINLAGAQARTGRLKEALQNYQSILDQKASADTAPFRRAAAEVLPELRARIPRVRLRPAGLRDSDVVEIDGEEISRQALAEPTSLDPGAHTIVVKRSGAERARVTFTLAERESHDISLAVPVESALAPGAPVATTAHPGADLTMAQAEQPRPASPRSLWRSPWTWAAVATVVVAASIATVYAVDHGDEPFSGNVPPGLVTVK
jgi:hypothetical protein